MKYRRLSNEELAPLHKQFVDFLVINGIIAEDWEKMKKEAPIEVEGILDQFSDVVFESNLRKIQFLEVIEPKTLYAFQCLSDKIILRGLQAADNVEIDFTKPADLQSATVNAPKGVVLLKSEKKYTKVREQEMFQMTLNGALVSDGKLFKALCLAEIG